MEQIAEPLITVITLTRNRGKLISRAINSVLSQSYRNIEYIIVDGASTDNTEKIVQTFAENDNRVKYIRQEINIRPVLSIDQAFEVSKGEYITFLDDDDEYLPKKIEKQFILLSSLTNEYGFVYCWMDYYDEQSKKLIREHHDTLRGDVSVEVIEKPVLGGTPTLFFRRKVFEEIGGWSKKISKPSDWEMRARAAQLYKVDVVEEVLVKVYVNHDYDRQSNAHQILTVDRVMERIEFKEHVLNEFKEKFTVFPKRSIGHITSLIRDYFLIGDFKNGFKSLNRGLRISPTNKKLYRSVYTGLSNKIRN